MFLGGRKKECRKVRESLSEYIDGWLCGNDESFIERHLETCAGCSNELETLRLTVGLLNRVPSVSVPRSFAIREADVAEAEAVGQRSRGVLHHAPAFVAAGAGIGRASMIAPERLRWLRPATAVVAVALVVVLAIDFLQVVPQDGLVELQPQAEQAPARAFAPPEPGGEEGVLKMRDAEPGMPPPAPAPGEMDDATVESRAGEAGAGLEETVVEVEHGWPMRPIEIAVGSVFVALVALVLFRWRRGRMKTGQSW